MKLGFVAGVTERVYFHVASAADFPGWNYDLIGCFAGLGAPLAAIARRVKSSLTADGTCL